MLSLFFADFGAPSFFWVRWPALRALFLPRFGAFYSGLTALVQNSALSIEDAPRVLKTIDAVAGMTASMTSAVRRVAGEASPSPDPLLVELAQVLVQTQFLSMFQAGTACAERHARSSGISPAGRAAFSLAFMDVAKWLPGCLYNCFCISSPPPLGGALGFASPEIQQAALSWFPAMLELIKADSWLGRWPADKLSILLTWGLGTPLAIMTLRAGEQCSADLQPLPWADRPQYLECVLQAAEWILSAAGGDVDAKSVIEQAWEECFHLANLLFLGE